LSVFKQNHLFRARVAPSKKRVRLLEGEGVGGRGRPWARWRVRGGEGAREAEATASAVLEPTADGPWAVAVAGHPSTASLGKRKRREEQKQWACGAEETREVVYAYRICIDNLNPLRVSC
jgi:hypothetical protein